MMAHKPAPMHKNPAMQMKMKHRRSSQMPSTYLESPPTPTQVLSLCEHNGGCSNGTSVKAHYQSTCVGVGGDSKYVDGICEDTTPVSQRAQFLTKGDMDDTSSVIAMRFMPLSTLLKRYDYSDDIVNTMDKAIDYHLCKANFDTGVWEWDTTGMNGGECKCTRKCENG